MVELDLWVYIVFGIIGLAIFIGAGMKTLKDKKAKKAKEQARNPRNRPDVSNRR